jgi:hypothetical protein
VQRGIAVDKQLCQELGLGVMRVAVWSAPPLLFKLPADWQVVSPRMIGPGFAGIDKDDHIELLFERFGAP